MKKEKDPQRLENELNSKSCSEFFLYQGRKIITLYVKPDSNVNC